MKIRPVGAELFHADGQTDMIVLIVAFRTFAKAPNYAILSRIRDIWASGKGKKELGSKKDNSECLNTYCFVTEE
jgi:hypothetical protein